MNYRDDSDKTCRESCRPKHLSSRMIHHHHECIEKCPGMSFNYDPLSKIEMNLQSILDKYDVSQFGQI